MQEGIREQAAALVALQLPKGAFLCVPGEVPNVMTIGWGGLAYFWRRDVFIAPVRQQRHTHPLLEKAGVFTVCVPAPGTMQKELEMAGTLSGRDGDKFQAIGLRTIPAKAVDAPVVEGCTLVLECVVRAKNAFEMEKTDASITNGSYPDGDFHTLYYGEVVACYGGNVE